MISRLLFLLSLFTPSLFWDLNTASNADSSPHHTRNQGKLKKAAVHFEIIMSTNSNSLRVARRLLQ